MKTFTEFLAESNDHEFIKLELAKKDIDTHSIRGPNSYKGPNRVYVRGGKEAVAAANKHIEHLGHHKSYVAEHAPTGIGSSPSVAKKGSSWAGD